MSIFIGSNAGETIEPGFVSPSVTVIGNPKTPGAGVDIILAGNGDDRVAGGGGSDIVFLGGGNDLYTWNSGDGNDLVDGGSGTDTLAFNGSAAAETIKLSSGPAGTTQVSTSAENGSVTLTSVEHIVVSAGDGDDVVDASGLPAGRASLDVIGGRGNDRLIGSTGDDTFVWNPGDGSDIVEGGNGTDTLQFNGSAASENMALSANGPHALLTRNVGSITMDLHGIETVNIAALDGVDSITIGDMAGTGVKLVNVDLAAIGGGDDNSADIVTLAGSTSADSFNFNVPTAGPAIVQGLGGEQVVVDHMGVGDRVVIDGGAGNDSVTANGTGGDDVIGIARDGTNSIAVFSGNGPIIDVTNVEHLLVQGGAGNDTLAAQNGIATLTQLTLDGGAGNDRLLGGDGNDLLLGGAGNDFVDGNIGADTADLGSGDDTFQWDPGDGSDVVEGGSGTDTLQFNGSNAAENIALAASGSHALLTRNIASVTMDVHGIENVNIRALGSADNITIGDLSGTDVKQIHVDLGGFDGSDDGAADTVAVAFTTGDDAIAFNVQPGPAVIESLGGAQVFVENQGAGDRFAIDGGAGNDSVTANGSAGDDVIGIARDSTNSIAVFAEGGQPISLTNVEHLLVEGGEGNDTISGQNGIATLTQLTIDGGAGNDTIHGGDGDDTLLGGSGNDFIDGNRGNDTAQLGAGDDTFQWDPGDGSDIVEGNSGTDTLQFNGSNAAEEMVLSANGSHALLTRNVGSITMDLHGIENVNIRALGSADSITIGDLTGTDVKQVHVDLGAFDGGDDGAADVVNVAFTTGDDAIAFNVQPGPAIVNSLGGAQVFVDNQGAGDRFAIDGGAGNDSVTAHGTAGDDVIGLAFDGTGVAVFAAGGQPVSITGVEQLLVEGGAGNDTIAGQNGIAALTHLTIDGGTGNDTLLGGDGDDTLLGGTGNDFVDGNRGSDTAQLGAGDDTFQWDPGDGSDVVEGDSGHDTLQFNGSNAAENIALAASGSHALLTRNIASVTMDLHGMESVNIRALGSADNIAVHDLTGTDVTQVNVDLAAFDGTGDGAADQVAVDGTSGADTVVVTGAAGAASVTGLAAEVNLTGAEAALDSLQVNLGGGNDVFDASGLAADVVHLTVNGGAGADLMIGSQGDDSFVWNPGDGSDTLEGQGGLDTMLFNGANIAENVSVSANGSRALFTRDVGGITMDLNDVERITFNALGGADNVVVNDLSGTDVTEVGVDLSQAGGGGDGAQDSVTVNATSGDDVMVLAGDAAGISLLGLAARIDLTGAEGTLDKLHVSGGAGDDVIEASGVAPGSIGLVLDGGEGDDVIIGSAGDDVLIGGPGDDILIGNGGNDSFQAGPGADVVIQGFAAGTGSHDTIDLRGIADAHDFAWVLAHASDVDGSAVLDLGGDTHVTIDNVSVASLHSDNFLMS